MRTEVLNPVSFNNNLGSFTNSCVYTIHMNPKVISKFIFHYNIFNPINFLLKDDSIITYDSWRVFGILNL